MKRTLFILCLVFLPFLTNAEEVEIDGIRYDIDIKTHLVEVRPNGYSGDIVIPSRIVYQGNIYTPNVIGDKAFMNCWDLKSIIIPNNITTIGKSAFSECHQLESIVIPSSVKRISTKAFYNCLQLSSVSFSEGLEIIEDSAFFHSGSYYGVKLPKSVKSIGKGVFKDIYHFLYIMIETATPPVCDEAICEYSPTEGGYPVLFVPEGSSEKYKHATGWNMFNKIEEGIPEPQYDFEVNGIAYKILFEEEKSVEVVPKDVLTLNEVLPWPHRYDYKGFIEIPSEVSCDGILYKVVSIGESAFRSCEWLEAVTIAEGIKELKANAFNYCGGLKSVILPNGLEYMGEHCLYNCGFTQINIPSTVKTIGESAFMYCEKLESIEIPDNIEILSATFYGCKKLKKVKLPNGLKYITANIIEDGREGFLGCFGECTQLEDINTPDSLLYLGRRSFWGCSRLPHFVLPEKFVNVNYEAFNECTGLVYVQVKTNKAFAVPEGFFPGNVYQDATLYVNEGMKTTFEHLEGWHNFKTIVEGEPNEEEKNFRPYFEIDNLWYNVTSRGEQTVELVKGEDHYEGDIVVPATVQNGGITYTVTSIGNAFSPENWNSQLHSVTLPNTILSIKENAFHGCNQLSQLHVPESVTKIGYMAFNSVGLSSIEIPNNVVTIDEAAFLGCYLIDANIGSGVKHIRERTFESCSQLMSVNLSDGIESIDGRAFAEDVNLESINFPKALQTIGTDAFLNCCKLPSLLLPQGLVSISYNAFMNCSSAQILSIPSSLTDIRDQVFVGCTGLETITVSEENPKFDSRNNCNALIETTTNQLVLGCRNTVIPSGVKSVGDYAFYECSTLKSADIPEGVTSIGAWAFYNCTGLTTLNLPETLCSVGNFAFMGCQQLENVVIPANMDSIGASTFRNCTSLKSVSLPDNLTYIGWNAFQNCKNLTEIYIPESVITQGPWAFAGCNQLQSVKVKARAPYTIDGQAFLIGIVQPLEPTSIGNVTQTYDGISISLSSSVSEIHVYGIDGQLVKRVHAYDNDMVHIKLPSSGIYIIQAEGQSKKIYYKKEK